MDQGQIEATRYPRNPLDILAQHIVATVAMDEWTLLKHVPAVPNVTHWRDS